MPGCFLPLVLHSIMFSAVYNAIILLSLPVVFLHEVYLLLQGSCVIVRVFFHGILMRAIIRFVDNVELYTFGCFCLIKIAPSVRMARGWKMKVSLFSNCFYLYQNE